MTTQRFTTVIIKAGSRTAIAIPFNPNEVWGVKQRRHITGSINGRAVRGSLGSDGAVLPAARRGLAARQRSGAGHAGRGDTDPEGPPVGTLAPDILAALDCEPEARGLFESLAILYRNGYIRWIESAKRSETQRADLRDA